MLFHVHGAGTHLDPALGRTLGLGGVEVKAMFRLQAAQFGFRFKSNSDPKI